MRQVTFRGYDLTKYSLEELYKHWLNASQANTNNSAYPLGVKPLRDAIKRIQIGK